METGTPSEKVVSYLTRIRQQLGVPPVEVPYKENSEDGDEPTEAAEGPRPRHCAICKAEMEYVGGTHRPSAHCVMEFLWDDIVRAVDVYPESCPVRTQVDLCRERIKAALDAARECESADDARGSNNESQGAPDPANQRRGPPPDRQGRLAFAALDAARECESADDARGSNNESQGAPDPANQRRGPPPDRQGRLAFAVS